MELDCRTAESMVAGYINHTLKTDEMEEFLDHIEHCTSCYDELETYFIVNKVTQQLDEQEDGCVLDFQNLLKQDIRRSRREIHKKRAIHLAGGALTILFSGILILFLIFVIFEIRKYW
ncbi:zf-HC2 domain-containing protein [Blautia glucerasea]|uniref:Zinc-finger domain-containing protein n=2 Tax=Lachnospiraceae TaxID=186803 RepID=A0A6N2S0E5_9FIRM